MKCTEKVTLVLAGLILVLGFASSPASAQEKKPNILFIMGDDIGWMQPHIYHRGLMVGETPNIDRIGNEGGIFMTYYAEQSCTAGRNAFFTGMHPLRTGMIPPQLPGSPTYLLPGTPALAVFLHDLGYNTGEFGKNHLGDHTAATDRARLPGVLGISVPPGRHAGRKLPGHQQDTHGAGHRSTLHEHAGEGTHGASRRRGPEEGPLPDSSATGHLVSFLRRNRSESELPGPGSLDARSVKDRG
jgi:arylsulfatase A-like enzyme